MVAELLDGLASQQPGVGSLGPQWESRAVQVLAVALLTVLQALGDIKLYIATALTAPTPLLDFKQET